MLNDVTQPFFWRLLVQTARADQQVQHRSMFATAVGTCEQPVFPAHCHTTLGVFGDVFVDFHPAIIAVYVQRIYMNASRFVVLTLMVDESTGHETISKNDGAKHD